LAVRQRFKDLDTAISAKTAGLLASLTPIPSANGSLRSTSG